MPSIPSRAEFTFGRSSSLVTNRNYVPVSTSSYTCYTPRNGVVFRLIGQEAPGQIARAFAPSRCWTESAGTVPVGAVACVRKRNHLCMYGDFLRFEGGPLHKNIRLARVFLCLRMVTPANLTISVAVVKKASCQIATGPLSATLASLGHFGTSRNFWEIHQIGPGAFREIASF